jgi:hypothetical protein
MLKKPFMPLKKVETSAIGMGHSMSLGTCMDLSSLFGMMTVPTTAPATHQYTHRDLKTTTPSLRRSQLLYPSSSSP